MTQLNLNTLKTNIKAIFDAANTTTASPIDLSANMTTRVQKVLKTHIDFIPPQNVYYPFVSVYVDSKSIELQGIMNGQANSKRMSEVSVKIAGGVRAPRIDTIGTDAASEQCELLMENVEEILRSNETLSNFCNWSRPTGVNYFQAIIDKSGFVRVGILDLIVKVYY